MQAWVKIRRKREAQLIFGLEVEGEGMIILYVYEEFQIRRKTSLHRDSYNISEKLLNSTDY